MNRNVIDVNPNFPVGTKFRWKRDNYKSYYVVYKVEDDPKASGGKRVYVKNDKGDSADMGIENFREVLYFKLIKDSRKLFTILANDKIYKVKANDCDTAMKAVEDACVKDYGEKDALVDMLNGAIRLIQADNYAQAAKVLGNALASVNNLAK